MEICQGKCLELFEESLTTECRNSCISITVGSPTPQQWERERW